MAPTILIKSIAPKTLKCYAHRYDVWISWFASFPEIDRLPVRPMALLMFIVACVQSNDRYGKVRNVFYGLNWIHKALNMPNPCQNEMTCTGREAAKRLLSKPVIKKQPVTPRDLKKLVAHLRRETNLLKMRTLTMAVLSYAGFFRYDEVSRLRLKDIQFKAIYLKIYVKSSKTDQYKSGAWVHIARTNRSTCPYRILRAYLKLAELKHGKDIIFRGISRSKHGYKLKGTKPISYSTLRKKCFVRNRKDRVRPKEVRITFFQERRSNLRCQYGDMRQTV